jgi:hypothetical protein
MRPLMFRLPLPLQPHHHHYHRFYTLVWASRKKLSANFLAYVVESSAEDQSTNARTALLLNVFNYFTSCDKGHSFLDVSHWLRPQNDNDNDNDHRQR